MSRRFILRKHLNPCLNCFSAGEDYTPVIHVVHFSPYTERRTIEVAIRDDQGLPRVEGTEVFELVLRTPINSRIAEPSKAVIAINDIPSDCKFFYHIIIYFLIEPFLKADSYNIFLTRSLWLFDSLDEALHIIKKLAHTTGVKSA